MPQHPDEVVRHTREDLIQALAEELGSTPYDDRIHEAYEQVIELLASGSFDPDAVYAQYFRDGPVATDLDLLALKGWAKGRHLL